MSSKIEVILSYLSSIGQGYLTFREMLHIFFARMYELLTFLSMNVLNCY